ncbi:MAG: hypothetical protein R2800_02605 [Flavipsychrobacter sp.]
MKKLSLATAIVLLTGGIFFAACNKTATTTQTVGNTPTPQPTNELNYTKRTAPVFLEITSTGCGGCGSWGKPTFKSIVKERGNTITPLAVHIKYNDNMITYESTDIGNNRYGQRYTPQLWVGDENAIVLNGNIDADASIKNINKLIDEAKAVTQPALAAKIVRTTDKIDLTYGVKFIDINPDGEYGLAAFLTEDGYKTYQVAAAVHPETHNNVIRKSAVGAFGEKFTGTDLKDMEKHWSHSFDISAYKESDMYITIILWKKDGNRYMPINGMVVR